MSARQKWTVLTRDKDGGWVDESEDFHSEPEANEHAKELASKSADGTFSVVCHCVIDTYMRSYEAIKL